ncbi:hypothetical protein HORIV_24710 [Vreelandella olivaria]|uniref:Uncharacterized protein n=1 Tax=Vreelandella olivaria TaxID=390919 RepID=A0ABN5WTC2_9GAMM|nr:hypothetical protein HORIV_24710 [Halomonas olivaria]
MAGVFDRIVKQQDMDKSSEEELPDQPREPTSVHQSNALDAAGEEINSETSARTDVKLREVVQELLRMGLLEESQRPIFTARPSLPWSGLMPP